MQLFDSFFSYSFCLISNHSTRLCIDLISDATEAKMYAC